MARRRHEELAQLVRTYNISLLRPLFRRGETIHPDWLAYVYESWGVEETLRVSRRQAGFTAPVSTEEADKGEFTAEQWGKGEFTTEQWADWYARLRENRLFSGAPVTMTAVRPKGRPLRPLRDRPEGIEPVLVPNYRRRPTLRYLPCVDD